MNLLHSTSKSSVYVELLDLPLLWRWLRSTSSNKIECSSNAKLYVFDITPAAKLAAWLLRTFLRFSIDVLSFSMVDVRDFDGISVYANVANHDLRQFREFLLLRVRGRQFWREACSRGHMAMYLLKKFMCEYDFYTDAKYNQIWHIFMLLHVLEWHRRSLGHENIRASLWIRSRPFMAELQKNADFYKVDLFEDRRYRACGRFRIIGKLFRASPQVLWKILLFRLRRLWSHWSKVQMSSSDEISDKARLFVEHYGHLNLDKPDCFSDLFFLSSEGIAGREVLLSFKLSEDPLDQAKLEQLGKYEIQAVARNPQATLIDPKIVPVFVPPAPVKSVISVDTPAPWKACMCEYEGLVREWIFFFTQYNIKLWTSWEKYGGMHIATADALSRVGGVSTIYQRSYEANSSEEVTVGADVIFGFSPHGFAIEQGNHSDFSYHVAVGYIGDYRFPLLKEKALKLREDLMCSGAKHIVACFDENTIEDERWFVGHTEARKNYAFWLEKILSVPDLGVIFKPKRPVDLIKRLEPIADLLFAAQATGRCRLITGGQIQSSYPPAFAALAADIAIHESLFAATAGLEAALAGVPTLLLDLEGWPQSPLYKLGPNVVFKDWPCAWEVCAEYFQDHRSYPLLGDWSSMIDELDPFHDGRAAERMSLYLKELLEGLRRNETPLNVMEMVAERYARRWGKDKIHRGTSGGVQ